MNNLVKKRRLCVKTMCFSGSKQQLCVPHLLRRFWFYGGSWWRWWWWWWCWRWWSVRFVFICSKLVPHVKLTAARIMYGWWCNSGAIASLSICFDDPFVFIFTFHSLRSLTLVGSILFCFMGVEGARVWTRFVLVLGFDLTRLVPIRLKVAVRRI